MERTQAPVEGRKAESSFLSSKSTLLERLLPGSLRGRFLAVLFGVLLPSLTLFGVLHHDSVKRSLLNEADQTLTNRAYEIEQVLRETGIRSFQDFSKFRMANSSLIITAAPEVYVDIVNERGETLWASQNLLGKTIPVEPSTFTAKSTFQTLLQPDGLRLRRFIKPVVLDDGTRVGLVLAESLSHMEAALEGSVGRTVILGLVVLSFTEILGNLAFRNIFHPLRQVVDTAESIIRTDDVTQRVPVYLDTDAEIRRTAQAFNALMNRVEHLLEVAKRLLADTSHELRNPLAAIMTDLDLLREDLSKEQRDEVVQEAQKTVRRLTRLVSDLLLLSRTEASSEKLKLSEVDIGELVQRVASSFARQLEDPTKIQVRNDLSAEAYDLRLDPERTEQILTNLLENGLRYSESDAVQVHLFEDESNVYLSVKDNGCGIAEEEQEKVFHRFYRVDRSRNRHSGGTGLGLSVARALARLQGGDITLTSAPGEGADFRVRLPKG